jgi:hypothetical protein
LSQQAKYKESTKIAEESLKIREKFQGVGHVAMAESLGLLALLAKKEAQYESAKALYGRSLYIMERNLGKTHPKVATTLNLLADVFR